MPSPKKHSAISKKTKNIRKESFVLAKIFEKIAPRLGARILIEPEWGLVGQINFRNGRRSYFRYNTLDLNPVGASEIAKDKDYSNFFMRKMGYPIVPGSRTFFSKKWARVIGSPKRDIDEAYRHARKIGFPVVVKPNSGSQGSAVSVAFGRRDFYIAARAAFREDKVVLVQKQVVGRDYRLVILDDELISAYERIPLSVTGDGCSNILKLLRNKQAEFKKSARDTRINFEDSRIARKLALRKMNFKSIPAVGQKIFLLDNANLSTGGDSEDVTRKVNPFFKSLAIRLTRDMGLRLAGVDLMIAGDIREKTEKFCILEINSAPGLDHYSKSGRAQEKIVEDLYFKVLSQLSRKL